MGIKPPSMVDIFSTLTEVLKIMEKAAELKDPECHSCYDEFGSYACLRPAHKEFKASKFQSKKEEKSYEDPVRSINLNHED